MLTPENTGCSQTACNIINTFLSLDGFAALREQMDSTEYTAEHFGAELARVADREIEAGTMLSKDEAEVYAMEVLDANNDIRLGVKSQITDCVIVMLYEIDPFAKIRREEIRQKVVEITQTKTYRGDENLKDDFISKQETA